MKKLTLLLKKNDEINRKHLQQRKNKKFTYLNFKPTRPITKKTEFEHELQFQRKSNNPGENQPMKAFSVSEVILTSREN